MFAATRATDGGAGFSRASGARPRRSPHKEHPHFPLELSGLVEIGSREYAGQVTDTQAWCGGWNSREVQEQSFSITEKQIWVIREAKIKAKGKNRKRPSLVQRRNEN